jgi:hypothetical protein
MSKHLLDSLESSSTDSKKTKSFVIPTCKECGRSDSLGAIKPVKGLNCKLDLFEVVCFSCHLDPDKNTPRVKDIKVFEDCSHTWKKDTDVIKEWKCITCNIHVELEPEQLQMLVLEDEEEDEKEEDEECCVLCGGEYDPENYTSCEDCFDNFKSCLNESTRNSGLINLLQNYLTSDEDMAQFIVDMTKTAKNKQLILDKLNSMDSK